MAHLSRRNFLATVASTAGLVAGATMLDLSSSNTASATPLDKLDVKLGEHDELKPVGGSTVIESPELGGKIIIAHTAENAFTALSAKCMHKGCTVGYNEDEKRFECPCHGSQYALDGSVLHGPTEHPLKAFSVSVTGDVVTLSAPQN